MPHPAGKAFFITLLTMRFTSKMT